MCYQFRSSVWMFDYTKSNGLFLHVVIKGVAILPLQDVTDQSQRPFVLICHRPPSPSFAWSALPSPFLTPVPSLKNIHYTRPSWSASGRMHSPPSGPGFVWFPCQMEQNHALLYWFSNTALGPTPSTSLGNSLEMQILRFLLPQTYRIRSPGGGVQYSES